MTVDSSWFPKTCPHRAASTEPVQTREVLLALRSRATSACQALNCDSLTSWRFGTHSLLSAKDRGEIITRGGGSDVDLNPEMQRCPGADPAAPTALPADPLPIAPEHRRGRKRSPSQQVSSRRHRGRPGDGAGRRGRVCHRGCGPARNAVPGHRQRPAHRSSATPSTPQTSPLRPEEPGVAPPALPTPAGGPAAWSAGNRRRGGSGSAAQEAAGSAVFARQGEQPWVPCRQA
ncbi:uncharacterized protein LOC118501435 [Phyllostomus discolor]|uniref:Uncharacterized protein LOC118501435 n=1 Tax=Phyllostomus discolor TaxID=89673 RepID=A0A7E6E3A7_9CHIR|nr:uncharacterized protein LOC118501435 [Phyllostomus discolor]